MRQPAGFTLVELLIYIAITSIALVIFTGFLADTTASAARSRQSQELQQSSSLIFSRLSQEIRSATAIAISGTTITITTPSNSTDTFTYDSSAKTLSLNGTLLTSPNISVDAFTVSAPSSLMSIGLSLSRKGSTPLQSIQFSTTLLRHQALYQ